MQIERRRFSRGMILRILGNVTSSTAPRLDDELTGLAKRKGASIIIDLSATPVMTSAGLGALLKCYRAIRGGGGRLLLCSAGEDVAEVLAISGLNKVFDVYQSLEEAQASFA